MAYKIKGLNERLKDCEYLYCFYYKKLWNEKPNTNKQDKFLEWAKKDSQPKGDQYISKGNCRAIISYVIQEFINYTVEGLKQEESKQFS